MFGFWALALFDFGFGCVCCVCCYLVVVFCLLIVRTWACDWFGVLVIVADFALDLMVWFGVIWVWVVRSMWICGWVVFGCIVVRAACVVLIVLFLKFLLFYVAVVLTFGGLVADVGYCVWRAWCLVGGASSWYLISGCWIWLLLVGLLIVGCGWFA